MEYFILSHPVDAAYNWTNANLLQGAILNFNHATIQFSIWHFLLVVHWHRASISNAFRDICIQDFLGHSLVLLESRDVIKYVNPGAISYRSSIVTSLYLHPIST